MNDLSFDITVPEYVKKFIDSSVDLEETPKCCCFFHQEEKPSFSYQPSTGRWRCFGKCHTGGDVVDMHRMNYRLNTREEAVESLCRLIGKPYKKITSIDELKKEVAVNEEQVELGRVYNLCLLHATTVDRWLELDYAMSCYPVDVYRLKDLLQEWSVKV